jgi:hypothetical protein
MQRLNMILAAAALVLSACADVEKSDLESSTPTSNVTTTEPSPGVVTGEFKKDAAGTQRLVGTGTATKETYLEVAPGSLAVDTAITVQEGADLGSTLPAELGLGEVAILGGSHATMIGSNPDDTETTSPFTISIPLPMSQASGAKLNLQGGTGKVGILYLVKAASGNKIGLFILGKDDLVGTIVKYKGSKLGWFRIVVLSSAVASKEVDTTDDPAPK